jgi:hypothetical protein
MDAGPDLRSQVLPRTERLLQHLGPLGIIGDGGNCRPGHDQMCVGARCDEVGETRHDAERVFQSIPPRDLDDEARVGRGRCATITPLNRALDGAVRAIEAGEHRTCACTPTRESGRSKDRLHRLVAHVLVLG